MCKACELLVEKKTDIRFGDWTNKDVRDVKRAFFSGAANTKLTIAITLCSFCAQVEELNPMQLLTAKPVIYLVNVSQDDYIRKKNKWYALSADQVCRIDPGSTCPLVCPFPEHRSHPPRIHGQIRISRALSAPSAPT